MNARLLLALPLVACAEPADESAGEPADDAPALAEPMVETWDFYFCKIEDQLASIYLDLAWRPRDAPSDLDHLYVCFLRMLDPGDQGWGTEREAQRGYGFEDRLVEVCGERGLVLVGRIRNASAWQWAFYGPNALEGEFRASCAELFGTAEHSVSTKADGGWSYYHDFLYPSPMQVQWMLDRDTVDALKEHGDHPHLAREIDHWARFPSEDRARAFLAEVAEHGYRQRGAIERVEDDGRYRARVWREDPAELDSVHGVVRELLGIAGDHGGTYDGWECQVTVPAEDR